MGWCGGLESHLTPVTWVRILAGAFKKIELKSQPSHCFGICGPNPGYILTGALGKLLKAHTASLCKSENCDYVRKKNDDSIFLHVSVLVFFSPNN